MTGELASLVPFAAHVAFVYYVIARSELMRWFWEGWLQAPNGLPLNEDDIRAIDEATQLIRARLPASRVKVLVTAPSRFGQFRRMLDGLLSCPMCSGFWLGLLVGWMFPLPVIDAGVFGKWFSCVRFCFGGIYGLVLCPIVIGAMHWLRAMETSEANMERSEAHSLRMEAIAHDGVQTTNNGLRELLSRPIDGVMMPEPPPPSRPLQAVPAEVLPIRPAAPAVSEPAVPPSKPEGVA